VSGGGSVGAFSVSRRSRSATQTLQGQLHPRHPLRLGLLLRVGQLELVLVLEQRGGEVGGLEVFVPLALLGAVGHVERGVEGAVGVQHPQVVGVLAAAELLHAERQRALDVGRAADPHRGATLAEEGARQRVEADPLPVPTGGLVAEHQHQRLAVRGVNFEGLGPLLLEVEQAPHFLLLLLQLHLGDGDERARRNRTSPEFPRHHELRRHQQSGFHAASPCSSWRLTHAGMSRSWGAVRYSDQTFSRWQNASFSSHSR
jgi:hypothetical protein